MVVHTIEQRWVLWHYFENHSNVAECVRKLRTDFGRREAPSAPYVRYLMEKVKETGILSDKLKREKPKTMSTPKNRCIAAVPESVCEAPSTSFYRRSQQLNISAASLKRILHKSLGMMPYKVQLLQELKPIHHSMRFRFVKWNYRRCRFWQKKNYLFRWSSFWSWRVCNQAKFSDLGHRKPARIHWKADAPKTSHRLMRILVQRHNWAIFLLK